MLNLDSSCKPGGDNSNLKIKEVRVRSVWLCHGSLAAPASLFSGSATGNPVTHWWVEIETTNSDIWFCAQFNKPHLELTRHGSLGGVTKDGLECARRENDSPSISNKSVFQPDNVTMGEVYNWMRDCYSHRYNLILNNCQDFGDAFSKEFGNVHASNTPIRIGEWEESPVVDVTHKALESTLVPVLDEITRCTIS